MPSCLNTLFCLARTLLEKILMILVVLLLLAVIILAIILVVEKGNSDPKNTCQTKPCVEIAAKILAYIDPSVDPCDDFYNFSCGNFLKTTNIPDEMTEISTTSEVEELLTEQLRTAVEKPIQADEPKAFSLAKKYYQSCMNTEIIESIGLNDAKAYLKQFGGWPVIERDHFNEDHFDWRRTIKEIEKEGFNSNLLLTVTIEIDSKNSTKYIIAIDEADLGLDRAYLVDGIEDHIVKGYYDYMVDVAVIFGANKSEAEDELLKSLNFEIELAQITLSQEDRQDPWAEYNPISLRELEEKHKFIQWTSYMNSLLAPYATITDEEIVIVAVPKYLDDLEKLMNKTSKRVLANYLLWRTVRSRIKCLTKNLRQRHFQFVSLLYGSVAEKPRWKDCVNYAKGELDIAFGTLYVRNYFPKSAKKSAEDLVIKVQDQFKEILRKVDWMDESTRKNALQKLAAMRKFIAYPDELYDDAKLNEFYKTLEIDTGSFLNSSLRITQFDNRRVILNLRRPVNKSDWTQHGNAAVVNAYYNPMENSIEFPAGILQGVVFHEDRPNYMNYGGLGYTVGHEITHGFDNEGRQYDKHGNLVNWWAESTKKAYNEKTKCVVEQYNNYKVPEVGLNVNGKATIGENIADIGGIKEAYMAYAKLIAANGEEKRLPALHYSGRQMFWISASVSWCTKIRQGALKEQVLTDEHPPDKYRVWGSVSNMPEFAKDFNCKPNTPMNPEKKCYLW